jgi:hypothetical protein
LVTVFDASLRWSELVVRIGREELALHQIQENERVIHERRTVRVGVRLGNLEEMSDGEPRVR